MQSCVQVNELMKPQTILFVILIAAFVILSIYALYPRPDSDSGEKDSDGEEV